MSMKIQTLGALLLFVICGSQIMSVYGQSNFAEPPVVDEGVQAESPSEYGFPITKQDLLPPILGLNCLSPVLEIAGCLTGIVSGVTSQKFTGITSTCCKSILNPTIFDCLTQLLTILPLPLPQLPLGGALQGLQNFCNAIPAAAETQF
ncbi:hypothetical protein ACFE04_006805 [Oxalis oulophora]